MNTVASSYKVADTQSIGPVQFVTLARKVSLSFLSVKNQHGEEGLLKNLRDGSPVWSAGLLFGVGHTIVLTGVGKGSVCIAVKQGFLQAQEKK